MEGTIQYCKVCDKPAEILIAQIETSVLEMIKKNNPEWVAEDGSCEKCIAHYKSLDQIIVQED